MNQKITKFITLLILSHSMHCEKLKCYKGFDYSKDGEENDDKTIAEVECSEDEVCISAKGSFVVMDRNCEF